MTIGAIALSLPINNVHYREEERKRRKKGSRKEIKASKNNKTYIIPALKTNKLKLILSAPSSYQLST